MPNNMHRWRADVVAWAEEVVWMESPETGKQGPLCLAEHQKDFLREATRRGDDGRFVHRTAVACWSRREGKSTMVAVLLAWRMCLFTGQRLVVLSNSERQSQSNIFELLTGIMVNSPRLAELTADASALQTGKITIAALDNICECVPNAWRSIQGRPKTDALAVDELHAAQNTKAYDFASNQLETVDAQLLISSQAGAPTEGNPIFRLYRAKAEPHIHFSYLQQHVMPWAIALAEREKLTLLPAVWEYQHRNCWGQTGHRLLPAAMVETACRDYKQPQTSEEWRALMKRWQWQQVALGVGLDRAGVSLTGDRSVWTVTACHAPHGEDPIFAAVLVETLYTGSEAEILACWRHSQKVFGHLPNIIFEAYNCSDVAEKVARARLLAPTQQTNTARFTRLYRLFDEGRIWFPRDAGTDHQQQRSGLLKEELVSLEYDTKRAGGTKFKTQAGSHDDHVDSLTYSIEAADEGSVHGRGGGPAAMINTRRAERPWRT